MKLTDELKEKAEQAKSVDEAKDLLSRAGTELPEEDLEGVNGGFLWSLGSLVSQGSLGSLGSQGSLGSLGSLGQDQKDDQKKKELL